MRMGLAPAKQVARWWSRPMTGGAAWTPDEGTTWYPLAGVNGYWAVAFASPNAGWLVGVNGTILKISF